MYQETQQQIRTFLLEAIQYEALQNDDDIFEKGFVNSLFAMQLVLFVEQAFNVTVENDDLNLDNFRSVDAITNLVAHKSGMLVGAL
ncbi:MAG: phosphopantetheine-binding protein [Chloroflexota bacterium]